MARPNAHPIVDLFLDIMSEPLTNDEKAALGQCDISTVKAYKVFRYFNRLLHGKPFNAADSFEAATKSR
jgi:hypothetical protein